MSFVLRTIDVTADGRRITREKPVAKAALTVGRAAENDIHLADLAVEPSHARITANGPRVEVEALGTLGFALDGKTVRQAGIDARTGAELRFGGTRITVGEADGAVLLTVEPVPDEGDKAPERDGMALASVMPGKRALSWIFAAVILLAFLAVPIWSHVTRAPDLKQSKVIADGSWSPGPLSLAHHQLEGKCEACHVKPFESVRNETCVACHTTVHDHAPADRIHDARGAPGMGGAALNAVAHAFGKEGPGSCVECHREHEGMTRMAPPAQQFCADCHVGLKGRLPDTKLGDAGDFATLHPQFSATVVVDPARKLTQTVSLDANPRENSGLAFTHKLHLDPRGGVAKMASTLRDRGYGAKGLGCGDCHHPSDDGVRFKPVTMERDCEACHSLVYDKVGTTFRKLKHGDVDQMVADLSVAGNTVQPIVTGRSRPGAFASGQPYFARFSRPVAGGLVAGALGKDGVCGECHTATIHNGKPAVMPVVIPTRYMAKGWFDHAAHKQTACAECHAANGSTKASDVLLPKIAECRECHVGEQGPGLISAGLFKAKDKVPSGCAMCHAYHPTAAAPTAARRDRR